MNVLVRLPLQQGLPADPPDAYVEALVRRAGTSFFWGMRRLDLARRRGVFAVYAFCREVDDIADGDLPEAEKIAALNGWRQEIAGVFTGHPTHPVGRALTGPVAAFGLCEADFIAVIDGMKMDAPVRIRIRDMAELQLYCDRVAGAVGRLCAPIFGLGEAEGKAVAAALGEAMQLTNILRDIGEDAGRDRVYLPADALADAGAAGDDIAEVLTAPGLPDLCARLAARAEQLFKDADAVLQRADRAAARPAVMMMQVYARVLENLRRRGWTELHRPVGPNRLHKIWIALRYGLLG